MLNGTDKNNEISIRNSLVEKTIRKYADTIYRVAFQYTGNVSDAQDILQDVSVALVTAKVPFDDDCYLRNWICRVTVNKCINLRKSKKHHSWEELNENIPENNCEQISLSDELERLPVKYRTVLYLYYYEEFSIEEIADILSLNSNTVGSRLRRGREKLRKILTEGD